MINKWENIDENEKKEVHEAFVQAFCECLNIKEYEAEKMWGDIVFDLYAKKALENLKQGNSIDGTGLKEFQKRLSNFLIHERLITELLQTVYTVKFVATEVASKINERLFVLEDDIKTLEGKIEKTKPCIALMKKGVQILETNVTSQKSTCISNVEGEYHKYFSNLVINFERDFEMPPVSGLKDDQREKYTQTLEQKLSKYRQEKLENWHKISKGIVSDVINPLNNLFSREIDDYTQQRERIRQVYQHIRIVHQKQFH